MSDHSDDEPSFPDPPRLARDAAEVVPVAPDGSLEEHVFSAAAPGAELHFQVVRLRDQISRVGRRRRGGRKTSARRDEHGAQDPHERRTLGDDAHARGRRGRGERGRRVRGRRGWCRRRGGSPSSQTARRLAKRTGACVVASVNIPAEHVDLLAFAERTLAARLSELGM